MGCGIELQSEDEKKEGYVPESVLAEKGNAICKRCFKIKNYGQYIPVKLTEEDYVKEVKKVLPNAGLILLVVDIMEFETSMDENIIKLIKGKPVILIVNKMDILPREMNPSRTAVWVHKKLESYKLKILDIAMLSTIKNYGVNGVMRKINHFYKNGVTAVVMGTTNVGKSTFVNSFFTNEGYMTVSKYPGTTLSFIKSKIPDTNINIIDTPGIIPNGRISDKVCEECNIKIVPSKKVVSKRIKLDAERVLMFGGLVSIQNIDIEGERPIIDVFTTPDIKLHETNIEKSENLISRIDDRIFSVPCDKCKDKYYENEFEYSEFEIESDKDFVIKGLGWIAVRRGPMKIKVKAPKGTGFVERDVFIPGKY